MTTATVVGFDPTTADLYVHLDDRDVLADLAVIEGRS